MARKKGSRDKQKRRRNLGLQLAGYGIGGGLAGTGAAVVANNNELQKITKEKLPEIVQTDSIVKNMIAREKRVKAQKQILEDLIPKHNLRLAGGLIGGGLIAAGANAAYHKYKDRKKSSSNKSK